MKIVVGYVKSPEGAAAVDRAIEEARLRNASLVIVHSSKGGLREDVDEAVAYQDQLDEIDRRLAGQGVTHEVRQLTRGKDPVDDLIDVVHNTEAEMIVIGLRRRSAVGKFVLGSNAQQILMDADCAVLCVKASSNR